MIRIVFGPYPLHPRRIALLAVERIADQRFLRLIMYRQRTILQSAGNEDPAFAIGLHEKWIDARNRVLAARVRIRPIGGWLLDEIRIVVAGPFLACFIPPDVGFALRPGLPF